MALSSLSVGASQGKHVPFPAVQIATRCASTLLWKSLRIDKFRGAVPHVMLVVDREPCILARLLLEGYLRALEEINAQFLQCHPTTASEFENPTPKFALRVGYDLTVPCPSMKFSFDQDTKQNGSVSGAAQDSHTPLSTDTTTSTMAPSSLVHDVPKVTYEVLPFDSSTFMSYVQDKQAAFRKSGGGSAPSPSNGMRSTELAPENDGVNEAESSQSATSTSFARELIGCILIQRNAFQNELDQYRLRLRLFEMGIRVAEHCHLGIMSETVDGYAMEGVSQAKSGKPDATLESIFTENVQNRCMSGEPLWYAQACSFDPEVAEPLGKLIANSIDFYSWDRIMDDGNSQLNKRPDVDLSLLQSEEMQMFFDPSVVRFETQTDFRGLFANRNSAHQRSEAPVEHIAGSEQNPIRGVGAPLTIISSDGSQMCFSGGVEDCLLNTGYYTAAYSSERNSVEGHRRLFPLKTDNTAQDPSAESNTDPIISGGAAATAAAVNGSDAAPKSMGRLKKKDYLRMLKEQGKKPGNMSKPADDAALKQPRRSASAGSDDSDDELAAVKRADGSRVGAASESSTANLKKGQQTEDIFSTCACEEACSSRPTKSTGQSSSSTGASPEVTGASIGASIGGTFPIGEVISEAYDLSTLNGACRVFAYPDLTKRVTFSEPAAFLMKIEKGVVTEVSDDCPAEFIELLELIRAAEGKCYVRELGIGLNPFVGRSSIVQDITSFERQFGVHVSLGQRHPLFVKQKAKTNPDGSIVESVPIIGPVLKRKAGKFHIDVFIDATQLRMGHLSVDFTQGNAGDESTMITREHLLDG